MAVFIGGATGVWSWSVYEEHIHLVSDLCIFRIANLVASYSMVNVVHFLALLAFIDYKVQENRDMSFDPSNWFFAIETYLFLIVRYIFANIFVFISANLIDSYLAFLMTFLFSRFVLTNRAVSDWCQT